ncbi:MAG: hypothetical protein JW894_02690 [Bacteroidales bacterium]|nr:hypothetical protein [Bacteroidales bacterium]
MKKLLFFLPIITIICLSAYAQEQTPEKKVYQSKEDERIYVNKDLGIYLWLSTSPDPSSEKHRLISDTSARYSNPMYFDTEGYNTVRSPWAVDTASKKAIYPPQDIIFEVFADGQPPKTSPKFDASVSKIISGNRYYGGNLKISLKSIDAVSGIASLKYSLNGKPMKDYTEELTGFGEGENIIKYYATDNVGNVEEISEIKFYIDNTPPMTEYEIDGLQNDNYVSPDATIVLSATDSISGVSATYYSINDGTKYRYIKPIPVKLISSNEGYIKFYSADNLGNEEKTRIIGGKGDALKVEGKAENVLFEFYVDKEPPEVSLEINGDAYTGKYSYVSNRSKFAIKAEDSKSGVNKIFYSINSTNIDQEYKEPFSLEKEGLQYVRFKADDYVGNFSYAQTKPYYCDVTPPKTTINVGSPKFSSRDTLFISDKSKISLVSSDGISGVAQIEYTVNSQETTSYSSAFNIDNPGFSTISYYATDKLNNKEEVNKLNVYVDIRPPKIHYHFSVESIGNKTVRDEIYTIYPTNAMLYIAATDDRSGGERLEYFINESTTSKTSNPIKGLLPGNYLITVKAYDVLGNESEQKIKFAIEE